MHVVNVNRSSGFSFQTGESFCRVSLSEVSNLGAFIGNQTDNRKNTIELELAVKINDDALVDEGGYLTNAYLLSHENNADKCRHTDISEFESTNVLNSTLVPVMEKDYATQPEVFMEISVDSGTSYMANEDFSVSFTLEFDEFFGDSVQLMLNLPLNSNSKGNDKDVLLCFRNFSINSIGNKLIDSFNSKYLRVEPNDFENFCMLPKIRVLGTSVLLSIARHLNKFRDI